MGYVLLLLPCMSFFISSSKSDTTFAIALISLPLQFTINLNIAFY